jgi:hypothetical protein
MNQSTSPLVFGRREEKEGKILMDKKSLVELMVL